MGYLEGGAREIPVSEHKRKVRQSLKEILAATQPAVVGVSNQFVIHYPDCLEILVICKEIDERIITVIGGPNATFLDVDCLKHPAVDVVVRGEGEWTMRDLLLAIDTGRDLGTVQGITYRSDGGIVQTAVRELGDLRELPDIDFSLLPTDFIKRVAVYGMLSRGCVYNCSYCVESVFWKKMRRFPVSRIVREMKILQETYLTQIKGMDESMLFVGSPLFHELCTQIVEQGIAIPDNFFILSRVDTITGGGIAAMKQAGIDIVAVGVESASARVRKEMNKDLTMAQIVSGCTKLRDSGVKIQTFWIVGHPGDSPFEAQCSLDTLTRFLRDELTHGGDVSLFIPYPGTKYFADPHAYGIEILATDWRKWERYKWSYLNEKPMCQLRDFSAEDMLFFFQESYKTIRSYQMLRQQTMSGSI
jgi:radical SAM superfamily enzyme YgiQ (UPF0313 family)